MSEEQIIERTKPSLLADTSSTSWGNRKPKKRGFVASIFCCLLALGIYCSVNLNSEAGPAISKDEPINEELLLDADEEEAKDIPKLIALEDGAKPLSFAGEEVATYISRAYRIPQLESRKITEWALEIGEVKNLDPLLILAVIATESSFNEKAKSSAGAEGLMQVMTQIHSKEFAAFGGDKAALEGYPNMVVGTNILASLIKRTGSVSKGLKWYSGAANHKTDYGYSARVLRERSRMLVAAKGNANEAVQLSRKGKTPANYKDPKLLLKLSYALWVDVVNESNAQNEVKEARAKSENQNVG